MITYINIKHLLNNIQFLLIGEEHVLKTPAFADSVSEGDMRWEKSKYNVLHNKLIST